MGRGGDDSFDETQATLCHAFFREDAHSLRDADYSSHAVSDASLPKF